jgi:hypothetical protein
MTKTKAIKATDEMLATLSGVALQHRLVDDTSAKTVLFFSVDGVLRYYNGVSIAEPPFAISTAPHESGHWSGLKLVQVLDLAALFYGATVIDDRAMAWWLGKGQASHLYTEVIRVERNILLMWGGNNCRNLCHAGLAFPTQSAASAFVDNFRKGPRKSFRATTPFFVAGKGGVRREYWPAPNEPTPHASKWYGDVLDSTVDLTLLCRPPGGSWEHNSRGQIYSSREAATAAYNAWELALFQNGGRPFEVEWMPTLQQSALTRPT